MLRDSSAWIGVKRDSNTTRVVMTNGLTMDSSWNTTGTGAEQASVPISGGRIWLQGQRRYPTGQRAAGRLLLQHRRQGRSGTLGPAVALNNAWQFFMGYRYAIFNHATQSPRRHGHGTALRPDDALGICDVTAGLFLPESSPRAPDRRQQTAMSNLGSWSQ